MGLKICRSLRGLKNRGIAHLIPNRILMQRGNAVRYQSSVLDFGVQFLKKRERLIKKIVFAIAAFLLFTSAAFAQGTIAGTITDAKGNGIGNVTVVVVGPGGKAVATSTTDEAGSYIFDEIAAGKYKIATYGAKGFAAAFRDEVVVTDDDTTTVDIKLTAAVQPPVPKPTTKPVDPKVIAQTPPQPGINVRVGQKFSVVTESMISTSADMLPQALEQNIGTTSVYEVVAVGPDSITLRGTLSRVRMSSSTLGQEMSYDSSRKEDLGNELDKVFRPGLEKVRTVTISRSGKVTSQDEAWKGAPGDPFAETDRIGLFEPELTMPELKAGVAVRYSGNLTTRSGSYTVSSVNGGTASVSYAGTGKGEFNTTVEGLGLAGQSNFSEHSDLQIDTATRLVLSRETVEDGSMNVVAAGTPVPGKMKITISQKTTRLN
jgi:hypothetical protein